MVCSLLSPLPGGRWISFQDLEEEVQSITAEDVAARTRVRLGGRCRPTDVGWFAPFRMHRRIVSRLAEGRRFLIGDAAHLSSPFGGEELTNGLHDGYDLGWKLALVLRGHATLSLLDAYAVERAIADRHSLDVSDQVHQGLIDIADTVRQGRRGARRGRGPGTMALARNARSMLDIDYAGSPLVADYVADGSDNPEPHPGRSATWIGCGLEELSAVYLFLARLKTAKPFVAGATLVQARGDFSRP